MKASFDAIAFRVLAPFVCLVHSLLLSGPLGVLNSTAAELTRDATATTNDPSVLVTAAAVRKLSATQVEQGLPVRLGAVVTFYDPQTDLLFVQDQTAGIFIRGAHGTNVGLRVGQNIELEGVTRRGKFAPVVAQPTIRLQGQGRLPWPRPVMAEKLFDGTEDGNWVEVRGIVNSLAVSQAQRWLDLEVVVLGSAWKAHIPNFRPTDALPTRLVDARVKLRGVVGIVFNQRRQALGFQLFVPSLDFVQVERAAPADPFALSARPLNRLLQWETNSPPGHRVKVQGTVTLKWNERQIYLQDETGGIHVDLTRPLSVEPGTPIEVVGFPGAGYYSARLRQGTWRQGGNAPLVAPVKTTVTDVRRGDLDSLLVHLDSVLTGHAEHEGVNVLTLQEGPLSFEAYLRTNHGTKALAALRPGSRLRVTGVCEMKGNDHQRPSGFQLLLRSPEDVVVLAYPPWWTVRRLLTVLVIVTLAAALWLLLDWRRLVALQRKYSELFENATDLVYTFDLDGRFTALNKASERITGYSKSEARNRNFNDWIAPEHRASFRTWWSGLLEGGEAPPQELNILARDGQPDQGNGASRVHSGLPLGLGGLSPKVR